VSEKIDGLRNIGFRFWQCFLDDLDALVDVFAFDLGYFPHLSDCEWHVAFSAGK